MSPKLVVEKLPSSEPFDLAVRDGKTGFIFFNIEGDQYDYDVGAQLPSITDGRLLISPDFANALGRPSESGSVVGKISIRASMQPVDIQTLVNGEVRSAVMSPLHGAGAPPSVGTVPGPISPSEICPPWSKVEVMEPLSALGVGTNSCNNALNPPLHWFALPNNDHPAIPQNLYRMSEDRGGYSADSEAATPLKSTKPRRLHPAP